MKLNAITNFKTIQAGIGSNQNTHTTSNNINQVSNINLNSNYSAVLGRAQINFKGENLEQATIYKILPAFLSGEDLPSDTRTAQIGYALEQLKPLVESYEKKPETIQESMKEYTHNLLYPAVEKDILSEMTDETIKQSARAYTALFDDILVAKAAAKMIPDAISSGRKNILLLYLTNKKLNQNAGITEALPDLISRIYDDDTDFLVATQASDDKVTGFIYDILQLYMQDSELKNRNIGCLLSLIKNNSTAEIAYKYISNPYLRDNESISMSLQVLMSACQPYCEKNGERIKNLLDIYANNDEMHKNRCLSDHIGEIIEGVYYGPYEDDCIEKFLTTPCLYNNPYIVESFAKIVTTGYEKSKEQERYAVLKGLLDIYAKSESMHNNDFIKSIIGKVLISAKTPKQTALALKYLKHPNSIPRNFVNIIEKA